MAARDNDEFDSSDEAFSALFRKGRERRGRTQGDVARDMQARGFDFHQQTIAKIENGNRKVTIGEAIALAAVLEIELEELAWSPPAGALTPGAQVRESGIGYMMQLDSLRWALNGFQEIADELRDSLDNYDPSEGVEVELPNGRTLPIEAAFEEVLAWEPLRRFQREFAEWRSGETFLNASRAAGEGSPEESS